jgi:ribose/xylose/arabinose/galactoside ABC-type transport system permease subunit
MLSEAESILIPGPPEFVWFGRGEIFGLDMPVIIMLVAFVVGALVLNRTRYGEVLFAVGGSEEVARLSGVQVDRVKFIAFTISGALSGFAGALVAAWLSAGQPLVGQARSCTRSPRWCWGTLLAGSAGTILGSLTGLLLF